MEQHHHQIDRNKDHEVKGNNNSNIEGFLRESKNNSVATNGSLETNAKIRNVKDASVFGEHLSAHPKDNKNITDDKLNEEKKTCRYKNSYSETYIIKSIQKGE